VTQHQTVFAPLTIGILYCGGCNPGYDRVSLVETLKKRLSSKAVLVPWEAAHTDLVVAVQGCETACADLSGFDASEVLCVTKAGDLEPLVEEINGRIQSKRPEKGKNPVNGRTRSE